MAARRCVQGLWLSGRGCQERSEPCPSTTMGGVRAVAARPLPVPRQTLARGRRILVRAPRRTLAGCSAGVVRFSVARSCPSKPARDSSGHEGAAACGMGQRRWSRAGQGRLYPRLRDAGPLGVTKRLTVTRTQGGSSAVLASALTLRARNRDAVGQIGGQVRAACTLHPLASLRAPYSRANMRKCLRPSAEQPSTATGPAARAASLCG